MAVVNFSSQPAKEGVHVHLHTVAAEPSPALFWLVEAHLTLLLGGHLAWYLLLTCPSPPPPLPYPLKEMLEFVVVVRSRTYLFLFFLFFFF